MTCPTCRHNTGHTCTRLFRGLSPLWWRWGGEWPRNLTAIPERGKRTSPRWERKP